jgi:hypothetical protein
MLRGHWARQAELRLAYGHRTTEDDLVFCDAAGEPLWGRHLTTLSLKSPPYEDIQRAIDRCGTTPRRPAEGSKAWSRALDDKFHRTRCIRLPTVERDDHERSRQPVGGREVDRIKRSNLVAATDVAGLLETVGVQGDDVTSLPVIAQASPNVGAVLPIEAQSAERDLGFRSSHRRDNPFGVVAHPLEDEVGAVLVDVALNER